MAALLIDVLVRIDDIATVGVPRMTRSPMRADAPGSLRSPELRALIDDHLLIDVVGESAGSPDERAGAKSGMDGRDFAPGLRFAYPGYEQRISLRFNCQIAR